MIKGRKAQHEMVGFILIVVIVVVVALIFLALSLRQKSSGIETESKQVQNLLDSMMAYTTGCAIYEPQYESIRDLIKSCYYMETCTDGTGTCQKLKETLAGLLEAAQTGVSSGGGVIIGYEFNASYAAEQAGFFVKPGQGDILQFVKGKCSRASSSIGAQEMLPLDSGSIKVSLRFCY